MNVSRADDRDVFGHFQARLEHGLDGARRPRTVLAEDAVRPGIRLEQFTHCFVAGCISVLPADDVVWTNLHSMTRQGAAVSSQPSRARRQRWAADVCNPPAALFDQVLGGERAPPMRCQSGGGPFLGGGSSTPPPSPSRGAKEGPPRSCSPLCGRASRR